jgi:hypothetical protein
MKKSQLEQLNASLDKALAPPRQKPKENLDALLDEYNDERPSAPAGATTQVTSARPAGIPEGIPIAVPISIPAASPDSIPPPRRADKTKNQEPNTSPEEFVPLDATHTGSEKSVYSIMYRETISKGIAERHFGPAELMKKTGIRSRNTVHKALYGLAEKLSVEVVSEAKGNPLGPRYRVHSPKEIERRRKAEGIKIDPQTKQIVERSGIPEGIPAGSPAATANSWDTTRPETGIPTIPNIGRVNKRSNDHLVEPCPATASSSNLLGQKPDDEAFADLTSTFKRITTELTGKEPSEADAPRWKELAEILAAELRIAAGRTTVSSVPAFLAEHLRRRLWKLDKKQAQAEGRELPDQVAAAEPSKPRLDCPDCGGSGWWYPDGPERGVMKCAHKNALQPHQDVPPSR